MINTIDISPWLSPNSSSEARDGVVKRMADSCRTHGFFQITGHDIPSDLQNQVWDCSKSLFDLPMEEKLKVSIDKSLGLANRGYEKLSGQTLQAGALPDLKEGFFIGAEIPASDPDAGMFLTGPNQWPATLSKESFQEPLQRYRDMMVKLAETTLRILALGLPGAQPDLFDDFTIRPSGNLRLLHYPPQTSTDERQLGAGAHTDFGGITFLMQQPGTSGLQVWYPPSETWIPVPVVPGAYVVNIGDLLQRWTAGYYRSALHRVLNVGEGQGHRYSCAFFYNGNIKLKIRPLGSTNGEEKCVSVEEHIRGRLKESLLDKSVM